jgi:hypothetical protein
MARAELKVCDICGKVTDEIVGKVFFTTLTPARSKNSFHNHYELHADVGACCVEKLKKGFRWRKRMSAQQYQLARRRTALKRNGKVKK